MANFLEGLVVILVLRVNFWRFWPYLFRPFREDVLCIFARLLVAANPRFAGAFAEGKATRDLRRPPFC